MTNSEILDIKFYCSDLGRDVMIREYLHALLDTVWVEGEGFSGKRPFGNSGWEHDLYVPLIKAKVIKGVLDEDGYIHDVDDKKGYKVVRELIKHMCLGDPK
jgi:hypothetical protein